MAAKLDPTGRVMRRYLVALLGIPALFSDRVSTVLFLHYSVRCLSDKSYRFQWWYAIFLLLTVCMIFLERYLISGHLF